MSNGNRQHPSNQRRPGMAQRPGIAHRPAVTPRPAPVQTRPAPVATRAAAQPPVDLAAVRHGQAIAAEDANDEAEVYGEGEGYGDDEQGYSDDEQDEEGEEDAYDLTGYAAASHLAGAEHHMAVTEGGTPVEEYTADSYLAGNLCPMPSGKWMRLRPVSLLGMLDAGLIPNNLISAAKKMLYGTGSKPVQGRPGQAPQMSEAERTTTIQLMRHLAIAIIASFPVSSAPQHECEPGIVSVYSIWDSDLSAIVSYATEGQTALAKFRS